MKVDVKRFEYGNTFTISRLYVDGVQKCYVLEDVVREVVGKPVADWKVKDQTAIPKGTYELDIVFSPRFGKEYPCLRDVPGYTGILMHCGNTSLHTSGCLLLGLTWNGGDFIGQSRQAYDPFFHGLQACLKAGDACSLQIGDSLKDFS